MSANYSLSVVPDQMNLSSGVYATFGTTEINSLYGSGTNVDGATISTGRYVTLTVDRTIVPNSNFSKFYFYVNGIEQKSVEPDLSDNIESFIFPVYLRGNYTLQVSGYYDGKYYYSQEFSFNVVN